MNTNDDEVMRMAQIADENGLSDLAADLKASVNSPMVKSAALGRGRMAPSTVPDTLGQETFADTVRLALMTVSEGFPGIAAQIGIQSQRDSIAQSLAELGAGGQQEPDEQAATTGTTWEQRINEQRARIRQKHQPKRAS